MTIPNQQPQDMPTDEYGREEFSVPLLTPQEVLTKIASAEHASRLSMMGIIILSIVGVTAIVILFVLDKPEGATAISTMLVPTIAGLLAYRKGAQNNRDLQEVRVSVDGRLSQLLKKTDSAARAEGHLAAAQTRRVRATDPDTTIIEDDSTSTGPTTEETTLP